MIQTLRFYNKKHINSVNIIKKLNQLTENISRRVQSTAEASFEEVQNDENEVTRRKRPRKPEDETCARGEPDGHFPPESVGDGSGEEHGHEHPAVVDCAYQGSLPFLTAKAELKWTKCC